jgi:flagellar hook-associated protein 3
MLSRVTTSSFARNAIHYSGLHGSQILNAQKQLTSGLQFERPSEAPLEFRKVRALETRFEELKSDRSSITQATSTLNASVAQLQDLSDLMTQAKTLIQQGVQSVDVDERNALATELEGLLEQAKDISLARFNDNYLFGGTKSDTPPFAFSEPIVENNVLQVEYQGASKRSRARISDTIAVDTYYDGREVFGAPGRGETVLLGYTGAKPGGGTDTVVGRTDLQVVHTSTNYAAGSGVMPGADSVSGDTIIGPSGSHQLTIVDTAGDGSAGTISLNGGEPVAFSSADTNLMIEGPVGEMVYVDASNITAGFNGTVDIESNGALSIDGGASTIPIDFSGNQVVSDSSSGRFVTIDSTNIRATGTDHMEFPGTSNVFQVLHSAISDLRNERGLSEQEYSQSLDRQLGDLERATQRVFDTMGQQSTSLQTMQTLGFRVDDLMLSVESEIGETQATDFPDAVLRFENSQTLLQYTYAITAEISSLNLLQFLS